MEKETTSTSSSIKNLSSNQGFSLIEILVALGLIGLIFLSIDPTEQSGRKAIDEVFRQTERMARYGTGESVLSSIIVRIRFDLDKEPQEIYFEKGPEEDFLLSSEKMFLEDGMDLGAIEKYQKAQKELKKNFNRDKAYSSGPFQVPSNIQILGVASQLSNKLIKSGIYSFYSYQNGERDSALVIVGGQKEVASLTIDPFMMKITRNYKAHDRFYTEDELARVLEDRANEIYQEWRK